MCAHTPVSVNVSIRIFSEMSMLFVRLPSHVHMTHLANYCNKNTHFLSVIRRGQLVYENNQLICDLCFLFEQILPQQSSVTS